MKVSELLVDTNIVIYTLGGRQELADHVAYKLRLADAIVAASAAVLDVPLLTADRTFERLVGELAVEIYLPEG